MPNEKERQDILKTFFNQNKDPDPTKNDRSIIIRCSEGAFGIMFETDKREFSIYKHADRTSDDLQAIADDQIDDAITALGKKLIFEAAEGDVQYLEACLGAGASVNERNVDTEFKETPLHRAASSDQIKACEFLVEKGADIFAVDKGGKTALGISREVGVRDRRATGFLTEKRKEFCEHYYDQFSPTDEKKDEVLKVFYESLKRDAGGAVVGAAGEEHYEFSDRDGFKYRIKKNPLGKFSIKSLGEDETETEISPWEIGYALNDLGKKTILENPNLVDAELFKACLSVGVSANEKDYDGNSALSRAETKGNLDLCKLLIENGANVSAANNLGQDALMIAAGLGQKEVCKLLIEKGADILRMDKYGKTTGSYAELFGDKEISNLLRSEQKKRHDAEPYLNEAKILPAFYEYLEGDLTQNQTKDFTHQNGRKYQIVKNAAGFELKAFVGFADTALEGWERSYVLRTFGRNLNKDNGAGISKFFEAAQDGGKSKFIKACLDCGISVDEKDDKGKTALFYARDCEDKDTIKLLLDESENKHETPIFIEGKKDRLLKAFLDAQTLSRNESFDLAEGRYKVRESKKEDGEMGFAVDVMMNRQYVELKESEINRAIGDLGRNLIFEAAKSGNIQLYKACIDAGASKDAADIEGNTPLAYAKIKGQRSREVADEIAGKKSQRQGGPKKAQDKFRQLAILVRKAFDEHKEEGDDEIRTAVESVIVNFSGSENSIELGGLNADDMIFFMRDIIIKGREKVPEEEKGVAFLGKKPTSDSADGSGSEVQKLLKGKSLNDDDDDDDDDDDSDDEREGRRKSFYSKLLISCLEDKHHFLSEERTDNIRGLIAKNALDARKSFEPGHSIGDCALKSVEKDSVVDLYMRARFEELKKREGLKVDLTYEAFSENLGKVVKINSGNDYDRREKAIESLVEARKKKKDIDQALLDMSRAVKESDDKENLAKLDEMKEIAAPIKEKIDAKLKFFFGLKSEQEKISKDREAEQIERALNALLGSSKSSENNDYNAHRDLRIALNIARSADEFTPGKIKSEIDLINSEAAKKIQKAFKAFRSRLNDLNRDSASDAEEEMKSILSFDLAKTNTLFSSEKEISREKSLSYYVNDDAIQQVVGDKISNGDNGLLIHKFSGAAGFCKFTDQVAAANKEDWKSDKVSIAYIEDMPKADEEEKKSSFCVAVLGNKGATKIFSKEIPEITNRSSIIYEENLAFVTRIEGIKAAIAVMTDARELIHPTIFFEDKETLTAEEVKERKSSEAGSEFVSERELKILRQEFHEQIAGLKKCLIGSDFSSSDLPEEIKKKKEKLDLRYELFSKSSEGKGFLRVLEAANVDGRSPLEKIGPDYSDGMKNVKKLLYDKFSTESMRDEARKITSRQMQIEIAANVKSSMQESEYKFNLDGFEIAEAVATYQNQNLEKYFAWNTKKGFEKLLKEEMPASAYKGISVFRPRSDENIATVIFNGEEGDDTMYLTLPNSPQCYVRVSRCDKDEEIKVWRNGKEAMERHKKGDVIIDTGVVFHKEEKGKYTPIIFDELDKRFGEQVKRAALDFKIKAISVNEGQRISSSMLYEGKEISLDLVAKTSPIQKVDSHKPKEKPKDQDVVFLRNPEGEILSADLVVKIGKNAKLIISGNVDHDGNRLKLVTDLGGKYPVKKEYPQIDRAIPNQTFKKDLQEVMNGLSRKEKRAFKKELKKHFSSKKLKSEDAPDVIEDAPDVIVDTVLGILFQGGSTKYAVINSCAKFDLVVPVKSESPEEGLPPEIHFKDEKGELKRMALDDPDAKEKISRLVDRKFLLNFFSDEEIPQKIEDCPGDEKILNLLCERIKERCEEAHITVGFQTVKSDDTLNYESQYKNVGELEIKTFRAKKSCGEEREEAKSAESKEKPNFMIASGLVNVFTPRDSFRPRSPGTVRGG